MNCIETTGLTYTFANKQTVLKGIDLRVPEGSVYGFLGPNGAGKTTTLRLLLGLLKKQQGEINIFGQAFQRNRIQILRKLGSLIESPSLYGHLSAAENLSVWQQLYQCPKERIAKVLDIVGLSGTGKKSAGHFSLGMKQRLSIAVALLHNPSLLILDEPTNGLDPNGIIDIRELLKSLNKDHGMTILISSHLLAEIERMVTHTGIIHHGAILFQGTLEELHRKQAANGMIYFDTGDADKTAAIIHSNGINFTKTGDLISLSIVDRETVAKLTRQIVEAGVSVYQVQQVQSDLESIFIDLIK